MADLYVRSTDGSDGDNGTTWALAKATIVGVAAIDAAGDRIFISDNHSESTAGAVSPVFAGTLAAPNIITCVDDSTGEPPTTETTGAVVETTGNNGIIIEGHAYIQGIRFNNGVGGSTGNVFLIMNGGTGFNQFYQKLRNCDLNQAHTGTGSYIMPRTDGGNAGMTEFENCRFAFGHAQQNINLSSSKVLIRGGGRIPSTGVSPTQGVFSINQAREVFIDGFDFSGWASTTPLLASGFGHGTFQLRNCKLPASWTGTLFFGTPSIGQRGEMYNCASDSTNYKLWVQDHLATLREEAVIVKTTGNTDGDTPLAWRIATGADVEYPVHVFRSIPIFKRNKVAGQRTVMVDIIHNGASALTDAQVWVEVLYLGDSGTPLGTHVSDEKAAGANILATAVNQGVSTMAWDSLVAARQNSFNYAVNDVIKVASNPGRIFFCTADTGNSAATEPGGYATAQDGDTVTDGNCDFRAGRRQRLEVSFTAARKGMVQVVVCVTVASYTIYVDPKIILA